MRISTSENYQSLGEAAGQIVARQVQKKPNTVLGLATGSTPLGLYNKLVNLHQQGLDFSQVTSFNLDEYIGMPPDHEASYTTYMQTNLFAHINMDKNNIHLPNGSAIDRYNECKRYERMIKQVGGIDLQVLGLGLNGHIGFNEPGTEFDQLTHSVRLTKSTRLANSRFFPSMAEVPTHAITMGIKTIMQAKKIMLLVSGEAKASIVFQALYGVITKDVPASILQLHPNLTVIVDQAAACYLQDKIEVSV